MKKKYEMDCIITWSIVYAIFNIISSYLGLGATIKMYFFLGSWGIIGLYYYNKDAKEERQKKAEPQDSVISDPQR